MTDLNLRNKLSELLPDYKFSTCDGIFGVMKLKNRMFRDSKKNLLKTQDRIIYVSSEMCPNTDKSFRYALNYTLSQKRNYRCKNWYEYEYKKIFVSGKTDEMLIDEITQKFQ